jgi:hypothetical protein
LGAPTEIKTADIGVNWETPESNIAGAVVADYLSTPNGTLAVLGSREKVRAGWLALPEIVSQSQDLEPLLRSLDSPPLYKGRYSVWEQTKATLTTTPGGFDFYTETLIWPTVNLGARVRWGHFTSPDGSNWSRRPLGLNNATNFPGISGLAYGAGRFVAVSTGRMPGVLASTNRIYTSTDGENYSALSPSAISPELGEEQLTGLAFADGAFIAVGNGGRSLRSTDGLIWEAVLKAGGSSWRRVRHLNNRWWAVGNRGRIATSADGRIWTTKSTGVTHDLNDIASLQGRYLVVGNNAMVLSSTFRETQRPVILVNSIHHDASGFHFTVESEPNVLPMIEASTDLIDWVAVSNLNHSEPDSTGLVTFTYPGTQSQPHQFIRAQLP